MQLIRHITKQIFNNIRVEAPPPQLEFDFGTTKEQKQKETYAGSMSKRFRTKLLRLPKAKRNRNPVRETYAPLCTTKKVRT